MSAKRMLAWGRWLWGFWSASWQENPLVPNKPHQLRIRVHHHVSFHLLYRGTWYLTVCTATHALRSFRFPSAISRYLVSDAASGLPPSLWDLSFPSAISRYLVSDLRGGNETDPTPWMFPSAISRYLVSDLLGGAALIMRVKRFPSAISRYLVSNSRQRGVICSGLKVSIRYIAVLGFQLAGRRATSMVFSHVSIRYIAVLGFQQERRWCL